MVNSCPVKSFNEVVKFNEGLNMRSIEMKLSSIKITQEAAHRCLDAMNGQV
jgi:hypothetical protein